MDAAMSARAAYTPPLFTISCRACGRTVSPQPWTWKHSCGSPLDLSMDVCRERVLSCRGGGANGLRRFAPVLPLAELPDTAIGDTPILTEEIESVRVSFKLEYLNPGGSFKDRGAYVAVARCAEMGFDSIVVDSSGNAGIAIVCMGLRLGIGVDVFLPDWTPDGKKRLLRLLGARLHECTGDRMAVHTAAVEFSGKGAAYVGHWWNPYFIHGVKTMAYEVVERMPTVDYVVAPVGAGTVLLGLHRGFSELAAAGLLPRLPRLIAAQAAGFAPVCDELGVKRPEAERSSLADGIAIADPPRRKEIAAAVSGTGGFGVVVDDEQIAGALGWLTRRGFIVEPTSAVALAATFEAIHKGRIPKRSSVLVPLTGTGMKVLEELTEVLSGEPD
jgi:threonine synthase